MSGINLALITQDFPPEIGGIETYSSELASRFAEYCEHFFVIAPRKKEAKKIDNQLPYTVERIAASNPFLGLKAIFQAPALFRQYAVRNVFHAQWQTLPASVFARTLGQVDHIFVAAHARELLFNPFYNIPGLKQCYEWYKRQILGRLIYFFR